MLIHFQETHFSLGNIKCKMMHTKEIVSGHNVSQEGIKVDLAKIEVISHILVPMCQKEVRSFSRHLGYSRKWKKLMIIAQ